MMTGKKKTWRSHPELALVPMLRSLAEGTDGSHESLPVNREGSRLDALTEWASGVPHLRWREMFDAYPLFADDMIERDKGSNIPAMNSTLGLFHPETREAALASWAVAARLERENGFELSEPGSRIYKTWSLEARLLALRWATTPAGEADFEIYLRDWLRLYWTVEALATIDTPDGPISLRPGARSQGMFDRTKADYALAIALAKPWRWRRRPHPLPDAAWAKSDEILAFDALRLEIEASVESVRLLAGPHCDAAGWLLSACPSWPTTCETWYMRTTEGLACWCDTPEAGENNDDIPNSNTPGIAAMGAGETMGSALFGAEIWTLPPASRDHVRQKRVIEAVEVMKDAEGVPSDLVYRQWGAGRNMLVSQVLPGGELLYLVKHGRNGLEVIA